MPRPLEPVLIGVILLGALLDVLLLSSSRARAGLKPDRDE